MPPRELPTEALGAGDARAEIPSGTSFVAAPETDEIVAAEARADAARARAIRLRQQADAAVGAGTVPDEEPTKPESRRRPWPRWRWRRLCWRRPGRKAVAFAGALAVACAALSASTYIANEHREAVQQRQRATQFAVAARDGILTMLSINAATARADVQRFADGTTGEFKAGLLLNGEQFVKAVEQSNASTKGTVQAFAVQSMTNDSAIVLVTAKSEVTEPGKDKPTSRPMRIVVNLQRDGGQIKISKVEFVP